MTLDFRQCYFVSNYTSIHNCLIEMRLCYHSRANDSGRAPKSFGIKLNN